MTDSNSAARSPHPAEDGGEAVNAPVRVRTRTRGTADFPPTTDSDRRRGALDRLGRHLTPPEPWQHRPASLAAMWRYARYGGWTGRAGLARTVGIWWYRLVALPITVVCHYLAWLVARPSRAITTALVAVLVWRAFN